MPDSTVAPQSSMTLSISRDDAHRMMEASRALNKTLRSLQQQEQTTKPAFDNKVDHESTPQLQEATKESVTTPSKTPLYELVTMAAKTCGDALIGSFLAGLEERKASKHEIQTSLLLFLDMDKSAKLMTAFRVLNQVDDNDDTAVGTEDEKKRNRLNIPAKGAQTLFCCFLTAISTCIHESTSTTSSTAAKEKKETATTNKPVPAAQKENELQPPSKAQKQQEHDSPHISPQSSGEEEKKSEPQSERIPTQSPSFDSTMDLSLISESPPVRRLSKETLREIHEIATFASDNLMDYVKKKAPPDDSEAPPLVAFEAFGDWYNSGGYAIVPWLELLDLAKWDYAGKQVAKPAVKAATSKPLPPIQEETVGEGSSPPLYAATAAARTESLPTPLNFFINDTSGAGLNKVLATFDFTGAVTDGGEEQKGSPLCINITEDNLVTLRNLVLRTGLGNRPPRQVFDILLKFSKKRNVDGASVPVLQRNAFGQCIRELVPPEASHSFSRPEMEHFSTVFTTFFGCYQDAKLGQACVNVKELAVGFSVLCAGNKSTKLVAGFELLDDTKSGHLSQEQLEQYLRAYLSMLIGISLVSSSPLHDKRPELSSKHQEEMIGAVDNGARWTLGHFLRDVKQSTDDKAVFSFENFARWYTEGGFKVAPWLELLDLKKLLALLGEEETAQIQQPITSAYRRGPVSSPRARRYTTIPPEEVLFTFPLANERSLVVLREDATYVRSVVDKIGLFSMSTDDVWDSLFKKVKSKPPPPAQPWSRARHRKSGTGKSMDVDQPTFVRCMEEIIKKASKGRSKRQAASAKSTSVAETLRNFFQSFDLEQVDRVALNQLMGGLCLLCDGKKSSKLAFSFGLFDGRKALKKKQRPHSLNGEELFLFLRSFLIVMFSCCRQSLDMTAEAVVRYISDTAHMVAEDVMRYQWHNKKRDRVDFDEFGEWYNEGGFETAPWLELLDLNKWVLVDNLDNVQSHRAPMVPFGGGLGLQPRLNSPPDGIFCPPAPPDDVVDTSFLDDHALMPMDSIDEMDFVLMQQPSYDKENDGRTSNKTQISLAYSPHSRSLAPRRPSNSLQFHIVTQQEHGGYRLSVSQRRVQHLRNILVESGLYKVDAEAACRKILTKARKPRSSKRTTISKSDFDSAVRSIISSGKSRTKMSVQTQRTLSDLLSFMFSLFDRNSDGKPDAMQVACGFTVLCMGKKSDKLEHAFEVLDLNNDGKLSREEMSSYLESFLTVLLSTATSSYLEYDGNEDSFLLMSGRQTEVSAAVITEAARAGSEWATTQAFKGSLEGKPVEEEALSFDDFAEWYTRKGFGNIPWLELLDLRKWVLTSPEDGSR